MTARIPVNPSEQEFVAFAEARRESIIPLVFKLPNEGLFAWLAFAAIERQNDYAFLLESATPGRDGRYSFMAGAPRRRFVLKDGEFLIYNQAGDCIAEKDCADPLADLQAQLEAADSPVDAALPPFLNGVVGYMGYDCVHYFEPVGEMKTDALNIPDMLWMQIDLLAVFDHYRQELYLVKNCHQTDLPDNDWRAGYQVGRQEIMAWLADLQQVPPPALQLPSAEAESGTDAYHAPVAQLPESNYTLEGFCDMVCKGKEYIAAGDVFQVVLSQRFSFPQTLPALEIYRNMRRINPSPFMFYFKCDDFVVVGSSPELMLSCQQGRLQIRPIAGTRPRGADDEEDRRMEADLRGDAKETAEHLMLVDLGRNDLGRVAAIGSVIVPPDKFCRIERYSHVMHVVSDIAADLAADKTAFDAARATLPAGTLSGAPKVRAMQIINELEPCKRNVYGGFAGYMGHNGDIMTCIVIRTLVAKDGICHVQAGGGIVADSQPEKEYQESVNKAMAALRAATPSVRRTGTS